MAAKGYTIQTRFRDMPKAQFDKWLGQAGRTMSASMKNVTQGIWDKYNPTPAAPSAAATTQIKPQAKTGISDSAAKALAAAKAMYAPGGAYGKGVEAQLARGSKKAVAGGTQAMVNAGLASTSMPAGLAKQYEEEVATPARGELESRRAEALSGLSMAEAQMQEGASENAAMRGFQAGESAADRANRLSVAGMSGRSSGGGTYSGGAPIGQPGGTFASRALDRAKTMAINEQTRMAGANQPKQHMDGGNFTSNLETSDLMNNKGGGWAKGFWDN